MTAGIEHVHPCPAAVCRVARQGGHRQPERSPRCLPRSRGGAKDHADAPSGFRGHLPAPQDPLRRSFGPAPGEGHTRAPQGLFNGPPLFALGAGTDQQTGHRSWICEGWQRAKRHDRPDHAPRSPRSHHRRKAPRGQFHPAAAFRQPPFDQTSRRQPAGGQQVIQGRNSRRNGRFRGLTRPFPCHFCP